MSLRSTIQKLRRASNFAPVWSFHAERERLPRYEREFGIDKLGCERVVRAGVIGIAETDVNGGETVRISGSIDGVKVEIPVATFWEGGCEMVKIVTIIPT